VRVSCENQG